MKLFTLVFVLLAFVLASCASVAPITAKSDPVPGAITKLSKLANATTDLQAAAADATAHNDPVAAQCWNGLIPVVAEIKAILNPPAAAPTPLTPAIGVFSSFQQLRDVKTAVNAEVRNLLALNASGQLAKIRQEINLACGALFVDVNASIVDPLGLASGVAPK